MRLVTHLTQRCPLTPETLGNHEAPDWLNATVIILTRGNFRIGHTTATVELPKAYRSAWALHEVVTTPVSFQKLVTAVWTQPGHYSTSALRSFTLDFNDGFCMLPIPRIFPSVVWITEDYSMCMYTFVQFIYVGICIYART